MSQDLSSSSAHQDRLVLDGVGRVGFKLEQGRCPETIPFPSCLASALRYLGEEYPWLPLEAHGRRWRLNYGNVHLLAASGMAFSILWRPGWHEDNADLMFVANPEEVIRYAFGAAGYSYRIVQKTGRVDDVTLFRTEIQTSLEKGRPVLAFGVIGPPECCLITGYEAERDTLIGWNYFQNDSAWNTGVVQDSTGQFIKTGWFKDTHSLIIIGTKECQADRPDLGQIIEWTLEVVKTRSIYGRAASHAAFDAWTTQLHDDTAFAAMDEAALELAYWVHYRQVGLLAECRAWAGEFLDYQSQLVAKATQPLQAAAGCYHAEHDLMWEVWGATGGHMAPDGHQHFAKAANRHQIVKLLEQAKQLDVEAVGHLKNALQLIRAGSGLVGGEENNCNATGA